MFSSELARRYRDSKIVSISLFPGAANADLKGYAGSFIKRCTKLVGSCICFLFSGGDLEALTEDIPDREHKMEAIRYRDDDPTEPTRVIHRAITPLYAGTAPEAGQLNGRVGVSGLPTLAYRLTGHLNTFFSISPPGHASHFQVRRRSITDSRLSYGTGVKIGSRNTTRKTHPE